MPYTDQIIKIGPYVRIYFWELPSNICIILLSEKETLKWIYVFLTQYKGWKVSYYKGFINVKKISVFFFIFPGLKGQFTEKW